MDKAQVWIFSKSDRGEIRVLLLKLVPERGSHFQPMTGGVEAGETLETGALREAFEETGFSPLKPLIPLDFEFTYDGRWGRAHETVFAMEVAPGCPRPKLDPTEHVDFRWVTLDEAVALVFHDVHRQAIEKLRAKVRA